MQIKKNKIYPKMPGLPFASPITVWNNSESH